MGTPGARPYGPQSALALFPLNPVKPVFDFPPGSRFPHAAKSLRVAAFDPILPFEGET